VVLVLVLVLVLVICSFSGQHNTKNIIKIALFHSE